MDFVTTICASVLCAVMGICPGTDHDCDRSGDGGNTGNSESQGFENFGDQDAGFDDQGEDDFGGQGGNDFGGQGGNDFGGRGGNGNDCDNQNF